MTTHYGHNDASLGQVFDKPKSETFRFSNTLSRLFIPLFLFFLPSLGLLYCFH
jgi:hypothetical protein